MGAGDGGRTTRWGQVAGILPVVAAVAEGWATLVDAPAWWHVLMLAVVLAGTAGRAIVSRSLGREALRDRPWAVWTAAGLVFFVFADGWDALSDAPGSHSVGHVLILVGVSAGWAVATGVLHRILTRRWSGAEPVPRRPASPLP